MNPTPPGALGFALADGATWQIIPGHEEARPVVEALGAIMHLQPADCPGRPLVVVTKGHFPAVHVSAQPTDPWICDVGAGAETSPDLFSIQVSRAAMPMAREVQSRGGALVHGALAEWQGQGLLLVGPGTVGKSTASRRLPPPWRSLCDDASLVVRDSQDRYWAHPWPTWSLFYGDGPGGSWDVQRAVPLCAIFLLHQASEDRAEPVTPAQAVAALTESIAQVSGPMTMRLEKEEGRAVRKEWLAAVNALTQAVPVYRLYLTLEGAFWQELERVMSSQPYAAPLPVEKRPTVSAPASPSLPGMPHGALTVVYTGPSMNPTLRQPDLLTVVPCGDVPVRTGDVIYFRSPTEGHDIVHRVVEVEPAGLRTRGDNNPGHDPYLLQPQDVRGRVVSARDARGERPIAGGWRGRLTRRVVALHRWSFRLAYRALHSLYRALADLGWMRRLLPHRFRPRAFAFRTRHRVWVRWMIGQREVGSYDPIRRRWQIRLPFRLFVDPANLVQLERWAESAQPSPRRG